MSQDMPMTRARLFVLIDAFERDMRTILQKYVADDLGEQECLGPLYDSCLAKSERDGTADQTSLVNFLEMREGYDRLNAHRHHLPGELSTEIRELTASLDRLVGIRNRVMHARPLIAGDGDAAISLLNQFQTRHWSELRRTIAHLHADPTWEPVAKGVSDQSSTLHNLPLPDYDDTGLIGRSKETQELLKLLKRGREPVITITGEGGIGKTALAIEIAYCIVDDSDFAFDAVLWTSLKYEKLTAYGVREIVGSARDIVGAVQPLGAALDSGFSGSVNELRELLEGFNVLLILDNMETISGDEFRELYNSLPDSITYLITSRIGVGEYERRYALGSLSNKDSLQLFNQFVRARSISSLSRLTNETRIKVVQELRFSPLAIKWFALAVDAGSDPLDLIRQQDELLEFCVRSVYTDLSKSAKDVLVALAVLGRPLAADELVILLDIPTDAVSAGVQELMRGSMVRRESLEKSNELLFQIVLTETATHFLSRRIQPDKELKGKLEAKDREFREVQEMRVRDIASRSLAPVVVRQRTDADAPTCTLLRQALLAAKKGEDHEVVYKRIDLARRMNPDFWEVDRVEGFIRDSFDDLAAATSSYERAYANAQGEDRAVVAHFFAGHLARKKRDVNGAIVYAREAHEILNTPDTGIALGNYLVWTHQFDAGITLIESVIPEATGKTRVIAISSLAEGWKRSAESFGENDRNFLHQSDRAWKGFEIATAAIDTGVADERLRATAADCAAISMRGAVICAVSGIRVPALAERLTELGLKAVRLVGTRSWGTVVAEVSKLSSTRGAPAVAKRVRDVLADLSGGVDSLESTPNTSGLMIGEVVSVLDAYGFIRHPRFPENVFFHADDVNALDGIRALRAGVLIRFEVNQTNRGPRAVNVRPV